MENPNMINESVLAAIVLLFTYLLSLFVHRLWISPLRRFPGPIVASSTRLWYTYIIWRGIQHEVLPKLHEKYGDYVRVAPNEVHISNSAYLKTIYNAGSGFQKGDFFKVFQGDRKFDLVSERDRRKHANQRKLVAQIYSKASVRKYEENIDKTLKTLIDCFDTRMYKAFDISDWIQYWSFDTIGMLTFSKQFGFLLCGADWNKAIIQIRAAMDSVAWAGQNPWIYFVCRKYIFPVTGNFFSLRNRHGIIREFAIQQASERQQSGASELPDIMESLLDIHDANPNFDTDALQSMVTTNVFGGAETTSSSIRAVIYYLLKNPQDLRKLVEEIDTHRTGLPGSIVSLEETQSMSYLGAVILEAMRLFPPNGLPSARVVPKEGLEIDGKLVPGGAQLTVFAWSLHRRKDVFGPDADQFKPQRWLDSSHDHSIKSCFLSFGIGSRSCLGRHLADMEMAKCVATLFGRYDIQLDDPNKNWEIGGSFIKWQQNINVILSPRVEKH